MSVEIRHRKPTRFEIGVLSSQIAVAVMKVVTNNKILPKRHYHIRGVPLFNAAMKVSYKLNLANRFLLNHEDSARLRRQCQNQAHDLIIWMKAMIDVNNEYSRGNHVSAFNAIDKMTTSLLSKIMNWMKSDNKRIQELKDKGEFISGPVEYYDLKYDDNLESDVDKVWRDQNFNLDEAFDTIDMLSDDGDMTNALDV